MKAIAFAVVIVLNAPSIGQPAWAASAPPTLRKTPNLAKNAEAYPTLVGATQATARINRAVRAANARQREDMKDCRRDAPQDGYWWEQSVDAPLIGAHFRQPIGARQSVVRRRASQSGRRGADFRSEIRRAGRLAQAASRLIARRSGPSLGRSRRDRLAGADGVVHRRIGKGRRRRRLQRGVRRAGDEFRASGPTPRPRGWRCAQSTCCIGPRDPAAGR